MTKLDKAFKYALEKHEGQYRKSSDLPYFTHVVEVMKLISNWGFTDENLLTAAILHDTIEDCGVTKEDIALEFGLDVATIVMECTRDDEDSKDTIGKWAFMLSFYDKSIDSVVLKLADRICNVKDYVVSGNSEYASWYALQAHPLLERYHRSHSLPKDKMFVDIFYLATLAYSDREEISSYVYGKTIDEISFDVDLLLKVEDICINKKPRLE